MVTVMDEMTGRERLISDGAAAETDDKTCMVCSRYVLRNKSTKIICARRVSIKEILVDNWNKTHRPAARVRAQRCKQFKDMRGN